MDTVAEVEQTLGERMRGYEGRDGVTLIPGSYAILRVDGRAFHSYTRGLDTPYDAGLIESMNRTAEELALAIPGSAMAYVQSDEISVLFTDLTSDAAEYWFGGNVQKICSVGAAIASVEFVKSRGTARSPVFDGRTFTLPDEFEVANYFLWRQRDCIRNSVSMAAQVHFSTRELHGKSRNERMKMLENIGHPWNALPNGFRYGRLVVKEMYSELIHYIDKRTKQQGATEATRTRWVSKPCQVIDQWEYGLLAESVRSLNKRVK